MQLWVGLGNPGSKYARNRHNIGFMAVDELQRDYDFGPWKTADNSRIALGTIDGQKILLQKPQVYMNLSGRAVAQSLRYYQLAPEQLLVFHDELDLVPFRVKVKIGGGAAGHNGLRSMQDYLNGDFRRVRLGIGHPGHKDLVSDFVLGDFSRQEQEPLANLLQAISHNAPYLARREDSRFVNQLALSQ